MYCIEPPSSAWQALLRVTPPPLHLTGPRFVTSHHSGEGLLRPSSGANFVIEADLVRGQRAKKWNGGSLAHLFSWRSWYLDSPTFSG